MLAPPAMVRDRPQVVVGRAGDRKLKNERVLRPVGARGAWGDGGRICTPERTPRHEPGTRKLLKLYSRPTFGGPTRIALSISSAIFCHSAASNAAPGSTATMFLFR